MRLKLQRSDGSRVFSFESNSLSRASKSSHRFSIVRCPICLPTESLVSSIALAISLSFVFVSSAATLLLVCETFAPSVKPESGNLREMKILFGVFLGKDLLGAGR